MSSTKQFVWVRNEIYEERDSSGAITKQFFARGQTLSGSNYYYTRDHLGSVREMTTSSGSTQAQYLYDPYGRSSNVQPNLDSDFGFAGYYLHSRSKLSLTRTRAYNSTFGRFLTRDPIGEFGGANLYAYVDGSPVVAIDPSGLDGCQCIDWNQVKQAVQVGTDIGALTGGLYGGSAGVLIGIGTGGVPILLTGPGGALLGGTAGGGIGGLTGGLLSIINQINQNSQTSQNGQDNCCQSSSQPRRNSNPIRSKPGSTECWDNGKGGGQIRDYDDEGKAKTDYDFGHDHGAGDPHAHDWDWSGGTPVRGPGRAL